MVLNSLSRDCRHGHVTAGAAPPPESVTGAGDQAMVFSGSRQGTFLLILAVSWGAVLAVACYESTAEERPALCVSSPLPDRLWPSVC